MAATAQIRVAEHAHTTVALTRASLHIQIQEVLHSTETMDLETQLAWAQAAAMVSVTHQVSVQAAAAV